jgi:hypothetical protein|nr:MAG TPA_asm: hypothetical protein [Caudoviricetes sp.]
MIPLQFALRRRMMINNNKVIFSYTGNCNIQDNYLRLLSSGTLRFNHSTVCDVFLVGGGAGGSGGSANTGGSYDHYYAGPGGGGGYTITKLQTDITGNLDIIVTIGNGGSGGAYDNTTWGDIGPGKGGAGGSTSFGAYSASGGRNDQAGGVYNGGNGGSGGAAGQQVKHGGSDGSDGESTDLWRGGTGQGTTTRAFAEANGTLFSNGGNSGVTSPSDRIANTGDGGHGAMGRHKGGAGGSGIVILRFPEGTTITQQ